MWQGDLEGRYLCSVVTDARLALYTSLECLLHESEKVCKEEVTSLFHHSTAM